ncbi:DUF1488 family protein [Paraburkholderia sp. SARCC-3016]|uniref:DUF1488 family protein n=1 Tax=Paraburkholderia sp. SARCC-3016 TaxID=3058611 RepID=UPI00280891A4|nr:DUF1488 family protein [Paraburkholderia sp. SARCC-3016]MDQ7981928.1 DUF1488 family protein [Paraburkholderia sp. SARCC-3016]
MGYELSAGEDPRVVDGDVGFSLTIDGVMQRFVISHEALADHFDNGARADPIAAFETGKTQIVEVAASKFSSTAAQRKPGIIFLTSDDFD